MRIEIWHRYSADTHFAHNPALPHAVDNLRRLGHEVLFVRGGRWYERHPALGALLWVLGAPFRALAARRRGTSLVWLEETVPFLCTAVRLGFRGTLVETHCDRWLSALGLPLWLEDLEDAGRERALDLAIVKTQQATSRMQVHSVVVGDAAPPEFRAVVRRPVECRVLFFGHLHRHKDLNTLLQAVAILRARGRLVHLDLVGEGPAVHELFRSPAFGVHVEMHGRVPKETLLDLLSRTSVNVAIRRNHPDECFHQTGSLVRGLAAGVPTAYSSSIGVSGPMAGARPFVAGDPWSLADVLAGLLTDHVEVPPGTRDMFDPERLGLRLALAVVGGNR